MKCKAWLCQDCKNPLKIQHCPLPKPLLLRSTDLLMHKLTSGAFYVPDCSKHVTFTHIILILTCKVFIALHPVYRRGRWSTERTGNLLKKQSQFPTPAVCTWGLESKSPSCFGMNINSIQTAGQSVSLNKHGIQQLSECFNGSYLSVPFLEDDK